jgi:uncharacterized membrane protein YccC
VIDAAVGESARMRRHSPILQTAVDGLFAALAGWRVVAVHLTRLPHEQARAEADFVLRMLPQELQAAPLQGEPARWIADPSRLRRACAAAMRALIAQPAGTPSLRLLADQTAVVLAGVAQALDGLALLVDDPTLPAPRRGMRLGVPDWLPPLLNAGRAFVVIGAVALLWIVTAWPNGASAITFAAIVVILLAPRADQAYAAAMGFLVGTSLSAIFAAIVAFAVLPNLETYAAFGVALGLVLVPAGALMAQPWQPAMFAAMTANFIPLLAPVNQMSYDTQQFYNSALAIVAGVGAGAFSFRLLPPLSPAFRTRRLLALSLGDLRRLAAGAIAPTPDDWQGRVYDRLSVFPDAATPLQRAQLLAALSVGTEIIRLRPIVRLLGLGADLDAALAALTRGNSALAGARLAGLDHALISLPGAEAETSLALRARASILAIYEVLTEQGAYFEAGVLR